MTSTLNRLTDNLPHFRLSENFDDLMKTVKKDCESYFSKNLLLVVEEAGSPVSSSSSEQMV
jgi:hypothetical protein